jgi:hypothetical protein
MPDMLFIGLENACMTIRQVVHIVLALLAAELSLRRGQAYQETELTRRVACSVYHLLKNSPDLKEWKDIIPLARTVVQNAKPKEFESLLVETLLPLVPESEVAHGRRGLPRRRAPV